MAHRFQLDVVKFQGSSIDDAVLGMSGSYSLEGGVKVYAPTPQEARAFGTAILPKSKRMGAWLGRHHLATISAAAAKP
jgi:hypothetical protein